jgi:hypothetical protein
MRKFFLQALALLYCSNIFAAATESGRCALYNDSLTVDEANNRAIWALKCYPFLGAMTDDGKFLLRDTATGHVSTGYPIFAEIAANGTKNHVKAPLDPSAPCWDTNRYQFVGICRASCFTPDQRILFQDGFMPIKQAFDLRRQDIMVSGNFLGLVPQFKQAVVASYVVDIEEQDQEVLIINTAEGGRLSVTPNHPLVDGDGYMRAASQLRVGDTLFNMGGHSSSIVRIEPINYRGKVYNIDLNTYDPFENVIVAEGYLSGTVYFQNEGIKNLNRQVLRRLIPTAVLQ